MFFVLSKTLGLIVSPLNLFFILYLIFFFLVFKHKKKVVMIIPVLLLYFVSTPLVSNFIIGSLIPEPMSVEEGTNDYDVVIVLGGMLNLKHCSPEYIDFIGDVDRILAGVKFYKKNPGSKLLVSGGSGHLTDQTKREASYIYTFLREIGIPDGDIIIEATSRNTYENAYYSKQLIDRNNFRKVLLITSSYHMRRSLGCFKKQGINADYYFVDFKDIPSYWHNALLPSEVGLLNIYRALREIVGYYAYKVQGYI